MTGIQFEQRCPAVLRVIRRRLGMTQAEVAAGLGLAHSRVVDIEAGRRVLRLSLIHDLAGVFEMPPMALLREMVGGDSL